MKRLSSLLLAVLILCFSVVPCFASEELPVPIMVGAGNETTISYGSLSLTCVSSISGSSIPGPGYGISVTFRGTIGTAYTFDLNDFAAYVHTKGASISYSQSYGNGSNVVFSNTWPGASHSGALIPFSSYSSSNSYTFTWTPVSSNNYIQIAVTNLSSDDLDNYIQIGDSLDIAYIEVSGEGVVLPFVNPASVPETYLTVSLPAGNGLVLGLSGNQAGKTIYLDSPGLRKSPVIGSDWSYNQVYWYGISFPSVINWVSSTLITWNKAEGSENWLGVSTHGDYEIELISTSAPYFVIVNTLTDKDGIYNGPISVTIPKSVYNTVSFIVLNQTGNIVSVYSQINAVLDEDKSITGYTDTSGNTVTAPVAGGNNSYSAETSESSTISEIAEAIKSLASPLTSAFSTLASYVTNVVTGITGIFSWLPSEILTVFTACIIVALCVSLIKLFR